MKHEKRSGLGSAWLLLGLLASVAPGWAVAAAATTPAPAPAAKQPAAAPAKPAAPSTPAAPAAPAAQPSGQAPEELDELDEVLVKGTALYDPIVRAEDKFFKAYNSINKDDDFDTNCASLPVSATSKIEARFCMPVFFADATAEQMRLTLMCNEMSGRDENGEVIKDEFGNVADPGICTEPVSPETIFYARREEYVNNMLALINNNPELKSMAQEVERLHRERDALSHRFDDIKKADMAVRAEKNKDRPKIR